MKKWMLVLPLLLIVLFGFSQEKKHRVVWDLSSTDTTSQAAVFRQINNAKVEIPDLEIEVVFHGRCIGHDERFHTIHRKNKNCQSQGRDPGSLQQFIEKVEDRSGTDQGRGYHRSQCSGRTD